MLAIGSIFLIVNTNSGESENKDSETSQSTTIKEDSEPKNDTVSNEKTLVAYFSRSGENYNVGNVEEGNTALMASYIADYLNANSFEIFPVNAYPGDYTATTEKARKEKDENSRPEIKNKLENIDDYDTIFIGYPIWWGDMPMVVYTFLENYDFSGKTIILFNTHEGSGSAQTYNTIKNKLSGSNINTNSLAVQGAAARTDEGKEQTINWLKGLGY